mmetsp:Transcript_48820/g.136670  ORF Transcript_48820/g.136670 Transcript_48820/m.136670 type:complete len:561 (-) Transcript_48820:52-1734(-)
MPKKPDPPALNFAKDLEARLRQAPDLQAVLNLLGEVKDKDAPLCSLVALLSALATKSLAESGASRGLEAVTEAESLLDSAVRLNGNRLSEPMVHAMVRLLCAAGLLGRALEFVEKAQASGAKLRLRTLGAVLGRASETADRETCEVVWAQIAALGLEPQDTEYAAMLRGLRASPSQQRGILSQMLEVLPMPSDPPLIEAIAQVFGVERGLALQDADPPCAEGCDADGCRWRVGWTSVDAEGICALTGRRLGALDVSAEGHEELSDFARRLAHNGGKNRSFSRFQRWLAEQAPYDVIIDGANVGFSGQNREGGQFQYAQIDALVRRLREMGHKVLLVLHSKWFVEDADLTVAKKKRRKFGQISVHDKETSSPADDDEDEGDDETAYPCEPITEDERSACPGTPLHMIRTWKEWGVLLRVPWHNCDDWYWLFAAVESARRGADHVQVVSNDLMRDHFWRMLSRKSFLRWQDRHMTRVSMAEGKDSTYAVTLSPPQPFSTQAQVARDGSAWHFPVPAIQSRAEQIATGRPVSNKEIRSAEHRWLVAELVQNAEPSDPGAGPGR